MTDQVSFNDISNPEFDARLYASKVVKAKNVISVLRSIDDKIQSLNSEIHKHVAEHHKEFFQRISDLDNLQNHLLLVETKATNLSLSINKIKNKVNSIYDVLRMNVEEFKNLHKTCALLRNTSRISSIVKRIQSRSEDLCRISFYVNEVLYLYDTMEWEGVVLLETHHRTILQTKEDLIQKAWNLIDSSYELTDHGQLAVSLQVFYNLDMLFGVIHQLVNRWQSDFEGFMSTTLDIDTLNKTIRSRQQTNNSVPGRALSSAGSTGVGQVTAAAFHVAVWTGLDKTLTNLEHIISHSRLLGLTLFKQQDLSSDFSALSIHHLNYPQEPYPNLADLLIHRLIMHWNKIDEQDHFNSLILVLNSSDLKTKLINADSTINLLKNEDPIKTNYDAVKNAILKNDGFLGWASEKLSDRLTNSSNQSPLFKDVLESEYPKLLKLIIDFERRVRQVRPYPDQVVHNLFNFIQSTTSATASSELSPHLMKMLKPFETAYLSRSLSRLFDRVTLAFSTVTNTTTNTTNSVNSNSIGPDPVELSDIVQFAVNELAYATVHYEFLSKVARNLDKLIILFATKIEALIPTGTDETAQATGTQSINLTLVNLLCQFGSQLNATINRRIRNLSIIQSDLSQQTAIDGVKKTQSPFRIVNDSIELHLSSLSRSLIKQILNSVNDRMEEFIDEMHGEPIVSRPKYLENLQEFVTSIRQQFSSLSQPQKSSSTLDFNGLSNSEFQPGGYICGEFVLQDTIKSYLNGVTDYFLWNLALLRTLGGEEERLQLCTCVAEFKHILEIFCAPQYGLTLMKLAPIAFARLKQFPVILTQSTDELLLIYTTLENSEEDKIMKELPPSLVCQHLFARAPTEIHQPHQSAGWSPHQYVKWVLNRSKESEHLLLMRNALKVYAHEVQMRQQKEYATIYLQLKTFLDHFLEKKCVNGIN